MNDDNRDVLRLQMGLNQSIRALDVVVLFLLPDGWLACMLVVVVAVERQGVCHRVSL